MKVEAVLGGLVVVASAVWRFGFESPAVDVELWQATTYTGVAFLAFGLVRDVLIKLTHRNAEKKQAGEKLICFESLAGSFAVACGLGLLALDVKHAFHPVLASLGLWGGFLLVVSGETKDIVMVFRREKNHINLIPW